METSLSKLSEHEWRIISNTWARFGPAHWINKLTNSHGWTAEGPFAGPMVPLFKTKKAATAYIDALVLAEGHSREQKEARNE